MHAVRIHNRDENESDTGSTDEEFTWHGLGKFEYSGKVLPHALVHAREAVVRGGHHAAFCTFTVETAHKHFIKCAGLFARVYADTNRSEREMLKWVNEQYLWDAITDLSEGQGKQRCVRQSNSPQLKNALLPSSRAWSQVNASDGRRRLPVSWTDKFVHPQVRITRLELLRLVCVKFGVEDSEKTHRMLVQHLNWRFWGSLVLRSDEISRKFVGVDNYRRDFVRLKGEPEDNTCLSAQILMFVTIEGFQDFLTVPVYLRNPSHNMNSVTLVLIRWLSPHPDAALRDDQLRPTCPSPFDINHALWTFAKSRRIDLTDNIVVNNSSCYPDTDSIISEKTARFDLVQPESLNMYMNCTVLGPNNILETITLPFS